MTGRPIEMDHERGDGGILGSRAEGPAPPNAGSSVEEIVRRTEQLLPEIEARAVETERSRRIPDETLDAIQAAGLDRVLQPAAYGGLGLDWDAYFEVAWRLASACGSTGWVYSVTASQQWMLGLASATVQQEYFACRGVRSCSAFNPRGATVAAAEDGWALSGRWQYSSGCLHADWALLGAIVPEFEGPTLLLVPKANFRIEDTWHVSGLRGTGSHDIVIDEPVFVPAHRFVPRGPGGEEALATDGRGSYGVPMPSLTPWSLVAPVIGMAQGALNAFERATSTRKTAFTGTSVAGLAGPQMRIGAAAAALDAGRALARQDIRELIDRGARGDELGVEDRVRIRRDHAYIIDIAYNATTMLARAGGASSLQDTHPIQRFLRDTHAGAMQLIANWDEQSEAYGRVRLGLEPNGQLW